MENNTHTHIYIPPPLFFYIFINLRWLFSKYILVNFNDSSKRPQALKRGNKWCLIDEFEKEKKKALAAKQAPQHFFESGGGPIDFSKFKKRFYQDFAYTHHKKFHIVKLHHQEEGPFPITYNECEAHLIGSVGAHQFFGLVPRWVATCNLSIKIFQSCNHFHSL